MVLRTLWCTWTYWCTGLWCHAWWHDISLPSAAAHAIIYFYVTCSYYHCSAQSMCLATISVLQVFFACTVNNILSHHEYTSINNSFCTGLIVCVFTDTTTWTVILFERKTVEKALFLTVRGRTCLRFERLRMVLSFFNVSRCWDTYTSSNVWIKQWNCT